MEESYLVEHIGPSVIQGCMPAAMYALPREQVEEALYRGIAVSLTHRTHASVEY